MKVLILGLSQIGGGLDAALYFVTHGHQVRVTNIRNESILSESIDFLKEKGVEFTYSNTAIERDTKNTSSSDKEKTQKQALQKDIQWANLIVKTHSVKHEYFDIPSTKKVVSDISMLFSSLYDNPQLANTRLICVSGARSKTTTASALCHALNYYGKNAHLCGNMGISGFCELERIESGDIPDYIICELSYSQIRDTIELMNWQLPQVYVSVFTGGGSLSHKTSDGASHNSIENANNDKTSKGGIEIEDVPLILTGESDYIICPRENRELFIETFNKKQRSVIAVENTLIQMSKTLPHYMMWAFATLRKLGYTASQINKALKSFKGVPNRGELIFRTSSCMFVNDSSSSIPEAVGFTLDNFDNMPVHLICGGIGKSFNPSAMSSYIKKVSSLHLLDGSFTNEKLIPFLKENNISYNGPFRDMESALLSALNSLGNLKESQKLMQVILLSPGVPAQFDYYNEYLRGDSFRKAVEKLVEKNLSEGHNA